MVEHVLSFGQWVTLRRKALGLTREELARRVGCASITIRKIEADERRPSVQIAELLAGHLALEPTEQMLFVRAARAELAVDRLPSPDARIGHSVDPHTSAASPPARVAPLPPNEVARVATARDIALQTPVPPAIAPIDRARQSLIEQVEGVWIRGLLDRTLPLREAIRLGLTFDHEAVAQPWSHLSQYTFLASASVPSNARISDVFAMSGGELIILGAAGAGKTTMMLELTRHHLARAREDPSQPVPVVFHLSTWSPRYASLTVWLIDELSERYYVPAAISAMLLAEGRITLMLDGLDEVQAAYRARCAEAIVAFRREQGLLAIALCSRTQLYRELGVRIPLRAAVELQPLSLPQIRDYLAQAPHDVQILREALQRDAELRSLVERPLMLSIVLETFRRQSALPTMDEQVQTEIYTKVFAAYVTAVLQRRAHTDRYPVSKTNYWLGSFAQILVKQGRTTMGLQDIQGDSLPWASLRRQYQILSRVGGLLVLCGVGATIGGFTHILAYLGGPGLLLLILLVFGLGRKVWSARIYGLEGNTATDRLQHYVHAWGHRKNAGVVELGGASMFGCAFSILATFGGGWRDAVMLGAVGGILYGTAYLLMYGTYISLAHLTLRLVLWSNNILPWRLADFLDTCVDHMLLRKIGTQYIFIHHLLLEYFAYTSRTQDMSPTNKLDR